MKRRQLRLVKTHDPAAIFDNLDDLRAAPLPPVADNRRAKSVETFARFPHERALQLKISGNAWRILVELDRLILKGRGRNPVTLTNHRLRELGIGRQMKQQLLRKLKKVGVIEVRATERKGTVVTHLWFPKQP
jgi:hypothetical protein